MKPLTKEWKDGKNRYELHINSQERAVMYFYEEENVFLVRSYIGGGCSEKLLSSKDVVSAKEESEKWLVYRYKQEIDIHKSYIKTYTKSIQILQREG